VWFYHQGRLRKTLGKKVLKFLGEEILFGQVKRDFYGIRKEGP